MGIDRLIWHAKRMNEAREREFAALTRRHSTPTAE
jgi:hypothetical protein